MISPNGWTGDIPESRFLRLRNFLREAIKRLAKAKQKMEAEQMRAVTSPEGSAQPELKKKNTD